MIGGLEAKAFLGLARWMWALFVLVLLIAAAWWLYSAWTAKPKAEARLGKNTTEAAQQNGSDAVRTVGEVGQRDHAADDLTRSNADEIRNAPGADAPVNPAARDAGLRALCKRASYQHSPRCTDLLR